MVKRRTALKALVGGATVLALEIRGLADPLGILGRGRTAAAKGTFDVHDDDPALVDMGELVNGFRILPFGTHAPPPGPDYVPNEVPANEGEGNPGTLETISPIEASDGFGIPLIASVLVDGQTTDLDQSLTVVRAKGTGQLSWATTNYWPLGTDRTDSPLITASVVANVPVPYPIWPAGSPDSGLHSPVAANYLPIPGVSIDQGAFSTAHWISSGSLLTVRLEQQTGFVPSLRDIEFERAV